MSSPRPWWKMFPLRQPKIAQTDTSSYRVVMHLYCGMPNPVWIIRCPSQNYQFITDNLPTEGTRPPPAIGYDGFYIDEYKGSKKIRTWDIPGCSNPTLERGLLDMAQGLAAVGESEPVSPSDWVNKYIEVLDRHTSQNSQ